MLNFVDPNCHIKVQYHFVMSMLLHHSLLFVVAVCRVKLWRLNITRGKRLKPSLQKQHNVFMDYPGPAILAPACTFFCFCFGRLFLTVLGFCYYNKLKTLENTASKKATYYFYGLCWRNYPCTACTFFVFVLKDCFLLF